jgi:hypothetical protein
MQSFLLVICLTLLLSLSSVDATIGVDVSQPTSVTQFKCMYSNGVRFAVPRVYEEVGQCDGGGIQSIKNAHAAGIQYVDGYIYPDTRQSASAQINAMLSCLRSGGAQFGMIWLDIEGSWPANKAGNQAFIGALSAALDSAGVHHGVYTSSSQWSAITDNWGGMSHLPLWYPHWDGGENFGDFSPFGGWSKPAMKQYRGNSNLCGVGVDLSWY